MSGRTSKECSDASQKRDLGHFPMPTLRRCTPVLLALVAALLGGCKKEVIRTYPAPREPVDRLLAARIPDGSGNWFVVLFGPSQEVAAHEKEFALFVESVGFVDGKPRWTAPKDWSEQTEASANFSVLHLGDSEDKPAAIFHFGDSEHPLELTLTRVSGPEVRSDLRNVNRWRGQLALVRGILPYELDKYVRYPTMNGVNVVLYDLSGPGGMKRPMPPATDKEKITYTDKLPDGWEKTADPPESGRIVTFKIKDGGKTAEVNIQMFPGNLGGRLANVARWRDQLKLPEVDSKQLEKHLKSGFTLAGEDATFADIAGEGDNAERILGVLATRFGRTWSIKMKGPKDVVRNQESAFISFLRSIQFTEE